MARREASKVKAKPTCCAVYAWCLSWNGSLQDRGGSWQGPWEVTRSPESKLTVSAMWGTYMEDITSKPARAPPPDTRSTGPWSWVLFSEAGEWAPVFSLWSVMYRYSIPSGLRHMGSREGALAVSWPCMVVSSLGGSGPFQMQRWHLC